MNRLRILKQRIGRCNDVGILKTSTGYTVFTGRFQGMHHEVSSKRAAIQTAARWARPSKPIIMEVTQGNKITFSKSFPDGRSEIKEYELANTDPVTFTYVSTHFCMTYQMHASGVDFHLWAGTEEKIANVIVHIQNGDNENCPPPNKIIHSVNRSIFLKALDKIKDDNVDFFLDHFV